MKQNSSPALVRLACALLMGTAAIVPMARAQAQISVGITLAPPPLPVYEQPLLVDDGGIWAPGYWDYGQEGYFWVPGTWVQPPQAGLLWTPGYWGWGAGAYLWNAGYWGATVGFYGGINYGYGYSGRGYDGGHWQGQHFYYNTAVSRVNVTNVHNTYAQTVVVDHTVNRVSFNGGIGGVAARPTAAEQAAARAPHHSATAVQVQHREAAASSHAQSAAVNHGTPAVAASAKPGEFNGAGVSKAKTPVHAAELPAVTHVAAPSSGNAARDRANQQQQNQLRDTQEKQRQQLQKQQATEHAQAEKQPANDDAAQELERQHQSQTQQLAERHAGEQQALSSAQAKQPAQAHAPAKQPEGKH